jgi:hypothetical protein
LNQQRNHACNLPIEARSLGKPDVTLEDYFEPFPFCGHAKDWQKPNFNPFRDVLLEDFVLCYPKHKH